MTYDMKKNTIATFAVMLCMLCAASCGLMGEAGKGKLSLSFDDSAYLATKAGNQEIPDTNDFILSITASDGSSIYKGLYGNCPESIEMDEGSYVVRVVSKEFSAPTFSSPQFGDEQKVSIPSGGSMKICLECSQINCGIALNIDSSFLSECTSKVLWVQSSDGRLMYSYTEKRTAFFNPGKISVIMTSNSTSETLYSRNLERGDMLRLNISAKAAKKSANNESGISVRLDTCRNWIQDSYVIGGSSGKGSDTDNALSVSQAKASVGENDIWVYGYIVGGDLSSAKQGISYSAPFKSNTNIAIASRSSVSDKNSCLSVQLTDNNVRSVLNLVDNPDKLGKRVCLKGDIVEAYYGIPGLKNVSECVFK